MKTKNWQPTAAHKRWHNDLAAMGCLLSGGPAEIDHLAGASARCEGVWIGQWFVAPLSPYWHRHGALNRTSNAKGMQSVLCSMMGRTLKKGLEFELFMWTLEAYKQEYHRPLPFDVDVIDAVFAWVRG